MDRSILIDNKTDDASLTLYIYCSWDPLCWLSYSSKIINAGGKYLYRCESSFKFEIKGKADKKKKMKTLCSTRMWEKDTLFRVTGSYNDPKVEEKDLSEYPQEKQLCVRRENMGKEISVDCGRNLYEILRLNMKEVRGKTLEEQNEMIKKAYHREIRRWHPDRNQEVVDDHICKEIIVAYDILRDPEKRARYNNEADYNNGWLSKSRWKSIFRPDCHTEEQKKEYRKRMCLMALSLGLVIGSAVLGGLGLGVGVGIGGIVAADVLSGGGVQSLLRATNRESVVDGCDSKKYLMSLGIGAAAGALLGGLWVGITRASSVVGNAAVQYLTRGTAKGSVRGVISSVADKVDKKLVSEKDVSRKPKSEDEDKDDLEAVGRICYISEGDWISKMIVKYVNDRGEKVQREVSGSGQSIGLPEEARDVKVWFEVLRFPGIWCDVKKYDRFNKCWCKPTERHNFEYETSVTRTFTIGGPLYYEAVIKVTDGTYQELDEM